MARVQLFFVINYWILGGCSSIIVQQEDQPSEYFVQLETITLSQESSLALVQGQMDLVEEKYLVIVVGELLTDFPRHRNSRSHRTHNICNCSSNYRYNANKSFAYMQSEHLGFHQGLDDRRATIVGLPYHI